jgi:hypothetical protein
VSNTNALPPLGHGGDPSYPPTNLVRAPIRRRLSRLDALNGSMTNWSGDSPARLDSGTSSAMIEAVEGGIQQDPQRNRL